MLDYGPASSWGSLPDYDLDGLDRISRNPDLNLSARIDLCKHRSGSDSSAILLMSLLKPNRAMNAAFDGDTVIVYPGTYNEDDETKSITLGSLFLIIRSNFKPDCNWWTNYYRGCW